MGLVTGGVEQALLRSWGPGGTCAHVCPGWGWGRAPRHPRPCSSAWPPRTWPAGAVTLALEPAPGSRWRRSPLSAQEAAVWATHRPLQQGGQPALCVRPCLCFQLLPREGATPALILRPVRSRHRACRKGRALWRRGTPPADSGQQGGGSWLGRGFKTKEAQATLGPRLGAWWGGSEAGPPCRWRGPSSQEGSLRG